MGLKNQDAYYMSPLKDLSEQPSTESVYSSKKSSVSMVALILHIGLHSFRPTFLGDIAIYGGKAG